MCKAFPCCSAEKTSPLSRGRHVKQVVDGLLLFSLLPLFQVVFGEYTKDVMSLANKYGVMDEGQLVSGQVRY